MKTGRQASRNAGALRMWIHLARTPACLPLVYWITLGPWGWPSSTQDETPTPTRDRGGAVMRTPTIIDVELKELVRLRVIARDDAVRLTSASDAARIRAESYTMRIDVLLLERARASRETSAVTA